jgi:hypothetical protein
LSSKVELQTTATINNKQEKSLKVNTLKGIPKYYCGVLVVSTFSFARLSNNIGVSLTPLLRSVTDVICLYDMQVLTV